MNDPLFWVTCIYAGLTGLLVWVGVVQIRQLRAQHVEQFKPRMCFVGPTVGGGFILRNIGNSPAASVTLSLREQGELDEALCQGLLYPNESIRLFLPQRYHNVEEDHPEDFLLEINYQNQIGETLTEEIGLEDILQPASKGVIRKDGKGEPVYEVAVGQRSLPTIPPNAFKSANN